MRLAVVFFVVVMMAVLTHLSYLFGRSLAWLLPMLAFVPLVWWLFKSRPEIVLKTLRGVNVAVLLLVSAFLSVQVWLLLTLGSVHVSAGHVLPLFIGTLLLYLYGIYLGYDIDGNPATERSRVDLVDSLARPLIGPPIVATLCVALVFAAYILLMLHNLDAGTGLLGGVQMRFLDRGIIPPITLLLFCWALLLLLGKWGGSWYVRSALSGLLPNFSLAQHIHQSVADMGANRKVADDQMRLLWRRSSESYLLPRYINWAVPILGFIGTVLGISLAADGIRRIISGTDGLSQLSGDLGQAIAPLGIAFDTTLIALSLSVVLTLVQTLVQRNEENLLADIEARLAGN